MADGDDTMPDKPYEVVVSGTDRDEWLRARKTGIGASESAAVLGLSPWASALSLYAEKAGAKEPDDLSDVEPVEWGLRLEPVIAKAYQDRTGREVMLTKQLLRSRAHPWALCTLDAWALVDGATVPLEIKTTSAWRAEDWADGPPEHYACQIQQQALITGADVVSVACLLGGQRLVWCDVERDEVMIRRIVYAGERFWDRVQKREPPPADGTLASRVALAALYPADSGEVVSLNADNNDTVDEWEAAKAERKALDDRILGYENAIKEVLGTSTRGILPDGAAVSWKKQTRPEHVVKASTFRRLYYHKAKPLK